MADGLGLERMEWIDPMDFLEADIVGEIIKPFSEMMIMITLIVGRNQHSTMMQSAMARCSTQ